MVGKRPARAEFPAGRWPGFWCMDAAQVLANSPWKLNPPVREIDAHVPHNIGIVFVEGASYCPFFPTVWLVSFLHINHSTADITAMAE